MATTTVPMPTDLRISPLGRVEGCPVGLSLVAGRGGDAMLLALAKTLAAG